MAVTTPKSALSRTLAKWSERTGVTAAARVKNTKSYFRRFLYFFNSQSSIYKG